MVPGTGSDLILSGREFNENFIFGCMTGVRAFAVVDDEDEFAVIDFQIPLPAVVFFTLLGPADSGDLSGTRV